MIESITAITREGSSEVFDVAIGEEGQINGRPYVEFYIRQKGGKPYKWFTFQLVTISENRRMVFMIRNNDHPELSGKGIVKAMIKAVAEEYNCDIVSSTNLEALKIDISEGRIPSVTAFWKKWKKEIDNVDYLPDEDRFIFKST